MRTSSRLIVTAALAGAVVLLSLTVASPALAEGLIPTSTVSASVPAQSVLNGLAVLGVISFLFVATVVLIVIRTAIRRLIRRAVRRFY